MFQWKVGMNMILHIQPKSLCEREREREVDPYHSLNILHSPKAHLPTRIFPSTPDNIVHYIQGCTFFFPIIVFEMKPLLGTVTKLVSSTQLIKAYVLVFDYALNNVPFVYCVILKYISLLHLSYITFMSQNHFFFRE